jgi:hypothetical protein
MMVDLRCPECFTWMQECCSRVELAELDKRQAAWRELLVDAYERSVVESMEALAVCLGAALALDLLGADDFAPRRVASVGLSRPRPPGGS